jgi:hypothetical protein
VQRVIFGGVPIRKCRSQASRTWAPPPAPSSATRREEAGGRCGDAIVRPLLERALGPPALSGISASPFGVGFTPIPISKSGAVIHTEPHRNGGSNVERQTFAKVVWLPLRDAKRTRPEEPPSLELLREGKLHFKHEGVEVHAIDTSADGRLRIECLTFADGCPRLAVCRSG